MEDMTIFKFFMVGIVIFALVGGLSSYNQKKAMAESRNKYMERGDKYLSQADSDIGYLATQAHALQALACYTAAWSDQ